MPRFFSLSVRVGVHNFASAHGLSSGSCGKSRKQSLDREESTSREAGKSHALDMAGS